MKSILVLFLLLLSPALWAQIPSMSGGMNRMGNGMGNGTNTRGNNDFPDPSQGPKPKSGPQKSGRAALDDSTKQIYGPHTVYYFLESDIQFQTQEKRRVDTSLTLFHRYLFTERSGFFYQDLGNQGSAIRSLIFRPNPQLGTQLGLNAYQPYAIQTQQVRYYDTKSPFSQVEYHLGAGGQVRLNFAFSRNVDSLWNIGFELQRLASDKNLSDALFKRGDRSLMGHWNVVLHSNYRSKNQRYRLLTHVNYVDHEFKDQGGLRLENLSRTQVLQYTDNPALFVNGKSKSNDQWVHWHAYQEFKGFNGLQLFQKLDAEFRFTWYKDMDFLSNASEGFYPNTYLKLIKAPGLDSLYQAYRWRTFSHQTGLKGLYRGFQYQAYLKQRQWWGQNLNDGAERSGLENYLGLQVQQQIGKALQFKALGEYLLAKDYRLELDLQSPYAWVSLHRRNYSPSLVQSLIFNHAFRWDQSWNNTTVDELQGGLNLQGKQWYFRPSVHLQRIGNYLYFDETAQVKQWTSSLGLFSTQWEAYVRWGRFSTRQVLRATTQSGGDVLPLPGLVSVGNWALDLQYKKLLYVQLGIDHQFVSAYQAPAYQPALQQYHLQKEYTLPAYLQIDAYASIRINRVRVFMKMNHLGQGIWSKNHYIAYLHTAMPRGMGFGVNWLLFD